MMPARATEADFWTRIRALKYTGVVEVHCAEGEPKVFQVPLRTKVVIDKPIDGAHTTST